MTYEEIVKNKLFNLWKKDSMKGNNEWKGIRISLGLGIVKRQGLTNIDKILNTIEEFGIELDKLDAMECGYDELFDVYKAIQAYRGSIRFLKELKQHMSTFKSFKGWSTNGNNI